MTTEYGGHWRVTKEQIKKHLPNFFYWFFYGGLGSLFPFLNLYYRSVGLGPLQIGVLGAVRPFVALFCGPVWCYISNKCRVRKFILLASLISWVAFTLPLGFVSHAQAAKCPKTTSLSLKNNTTSNTSLIKQAGKRELPDETSLLSDIQLYNEAFISKTNYLTKRNGEDLSAENKDLKDELDKRRRRNTNAAASEEKDPRFINLEKPFVNSMNTFGMKLQKHPYKSRIRPYDFKSRGAPYINKRINPYAKTIFIELFFLVLIGEVFQSPTDDLNNHYEGTFLEHLGVLYQNVPNNSLYSSFGIGFAAFFTGLILTYAPKYIICGAKYSDYTIAFYVFGVMMTLALVVSVNFRLSYRRKKLDFKVLESLKLLCDSQHTAFILVVLLMGSFRGVLFNFLYWNTAEIGGSELIVGVTVVSQYLSDTIMNVSAPVLMTYTGFIGMIYCGLASYGLRFLIFSWLSTPTSAWAIPSVELLQGISNATAWSAFILYITNYTPRSTYPVGIFLVQGLYLGVGTCIGGLLGGGLIQALDVHVTFRIFALMSLLACLLFIMTQPTGMNEMLPSEVDGLMHFADEDDYSSFSDEELLIDYDKRTFLYTPPKRYDEDGELVTKKKTVFPPANAPFVPMFMTIVKTQSELH